MTHTHTYAILTVSPETYNEIKLLLESKGYAHAVHTRPEGSKWPEVIDMEGLALAEMPHESEELQQAAAASEGPAGLGGEPQGKGQPPPGEVTIDKDAFFRP